jgi:hypothetical protein
MMNPKFLLLPFSLAFLLGACGPGSTQASRPEAKRQVPADALPGNATEVTGKDDEQAAPITAPPAEAARYRISPSQVGAIKIGMPVADLKKVIPASQLKETNIHLEGQGYKAYAIGPHQAGLLVEETCEPACRVWRIQVRNPAYRTAEGLGVGSSLGEVKKHYPISFLGSGETEIVAVSNQQKITFMLDVSQLPPRQVPWLNLQNTPDSVKVLGMLVL